MLNDRYTGTGKQAASHYVQFILDVVNFATTTWDPKLSKTLSQDGTVMGSVGIRKRQTGKLLKIHSHTIMRVTDCIPNPKGNFSRVSRNVPSENTFDSVMSGLYECVEEGLYDK